MTHSTGAPDLLVIWWSRTGASEQLATAVAAGGGAVEGCVVQRIRCDLAQPGDLLRARAYAFCCPENLASMAGAMKEFFDRCYYPLLGRIEGRVGAIVVSAGSDGRGAVHQIERIVTGWRLRLAAASLIVNLGAQTVEQIGAPKRVSEADIEKARELGMLLGEGLSLGIY